MPEISVAGRKYWVGASWRYVKDAASIKDITKANPLPKTMALVRTPASAQEWLIAAVPHQRRGAWLAAPLVAASMGDGIFQQTLSDERVWIVVAEGGYLVREMVVEPEDRAGALSEVLREHSLHLMGDAPGAMQSVEEIWDQALQDLKQGRIDKRVVAACRPPSGSGVFVALGAAGAVAALALGWLWWQSQQAPSPAPAVDFTLLARQNEERIRQELRQRYDSDLAARMNMLRSRSASAELQAAMRAARQIPIPPPKVRLLEIKCSQATQDGLQWSCAPQLLVESGASVQARLAALGKGQAPGGLGAVSGQAVHASVEQASRHGRSARPILSDWDFLWALQEAVALGFARPENALGAAPALRPVEISQSSYTQGNVVLGSESRLLWKEMDFVFEVRASDLIRLQAWLAGWPAMLQEVVFAGPTVRAKVAFVGLAGPVGP